jgi:hypothetical protein
MTEQTTVIIVWSNVRDFISNALFTSTDYMIGSDFKIKIENK